MPKEEVHHEHDVGYKYIFSHKETFIELLRSFINKDWVNLIKEEELILVDKSYVLQDFEEQESDIVYKINIEGKEVIFYILLEFQSKVDFQMPMRLLFYMIEVWRETLKNTLDKDRKRKDFTLPAIVPMVLYNGRNSWTARRNFKEILSGYELFGENIIDFNYILFDINRYKKEDLYELSNLVSAVFLLDQKMEQQELMKRLRKIIFILRRIKPEQFTLFKQWLKGIIKPRLDENSQEEIDEVLEKSSQEEVDIMVYNLEKTLDDIRKEGLEQGLQEGKLEVAKNLLDILDDETISKKTGLTLDLIKKLRNSDIKH